MRRSGAVTVCVSLAARGQRGVPGRRRVASLAALAGRTGGFSYSAKMRGGGGTQALAGDASCCRRRRHRHRRRRSPRHIFGALFDYHLH